MPEVFRPTADLSAMVAGFEALARKLGEGFAGELEEWGEEQLGRWRDRWGEDMAPLSEATLAIKRHLGYPDTPLVREGYLIGAATERGAPGNLFEVSRPADSLGEIALGVTDAIPYAGVQHDGGVTADGVEIPARPWDAIREEELEMLGVRIADSVRGALEAA